MTRWLDTGIYVHNTPRTALAVVTSFVTFSSVNLTALANQWVSSDGATAVATMTAYTLSNQLNSFVSDASDAVASGLMPAGVSAKLTGPAKFGYDSNAALEPDILSSDESA